MGSARIPLTPRFRLRPDPSAHTGFALLFVAGHLTHETRDSEGDSASGIQTNAVAFGKRQSFVGALVLFGLANCLLVVLALVGAVPRLLAAVGALYPLQVYWWIETVRRGLDFETVRRLQVRYRALYAAVGVLMIVVRLGGASALWRVQRSGRTATSFRPGRLVLACHWQEARHPGNDGAGLVQLRHDGSLQGGGR